MGADSMSLPLHEEAPSASSLPPRTPVRAQPDLEHSIQAACVPGLQMPTILRCIVLIAVVKLALRTLGFGRTIKWLRRRMAVTPEVPSSNVESVRRTEYVVAMAAAFYPGRALCLEQSLVLYYLLRRQGVPVKYCQGVQPQPFSAHAWVELLGKPINDVPEHVKLFARLPDPLP
jgi:hypothetical protein